MVSVIIPVYNREDVIERAILSVLSQTYPHLEIIVVNDGSADQTAAKCKRFGDRVRVISQKNSGPSAARNRGINSANGTYIAFLDSDDEWYPEKIEKQVNFALEESLPMIITDSEISHPHHSETTFQKSLFAEGLTSSTKQTLHLFEKIITQNFIHLSTVLIKKNTLKGAGLFDESMWIAEDTDLWLRVCQDNKTGVLNEVLAKRDVRPDKLSGDKIKEYSGRIYSFQKLLKQKDILETDRKMILERTIWVHGRLMYRCISDKGIRGMWRACRVFAPRLFSRKFYNGINSEKNTTPQIVKKHSPADE